MSPRAWMFAAGICSTAAFLISAASIIFVVQNEHGKLREADAEIAVLKAKPATPEEQLADFRQHCNESVVEYDLRKTEPTCRNDPGDGVDGRALVCAFAAPYKGDPPDWVICDKAGCSIGIRNGVVP